MASASKPKAGFSENSSLINNKYRMVKKIGSGSFGDLYLAIDITNGEEVAVKLEPVDAPYPQLLYESNIYGQLVGYEGIPRARWFGKELGYNCLVMDLLGPSLEYLFDYCGRKFSLKTVLMLVQEMITRVETLHSLSIVHRDIKPDNFLLGIGSECNKLYMIDFGLAKKFRDRHGKHIVGKEGKKLTGTARYCSINTHLGSEQSRRDDLESLGYVWIYFLRGQLPWQGMTGVKPKQKYEKICDKKLSTPLEALCANLPIEFADFLTYCRQMSYEDTPSYQSMKEVFRNLLNRSGFKHDYIYDWTILQQRNSQRPVTRASTSTEWATMGTLR